MREVKKRTAVIVGIKGQDGQILKNRLSKQKIRVIGVSKKFVFIDKHKAPFSIYKKKCFDNLIKKIRPQEVYYLAAHHSSSDSELNEDTEESYKQNHAVHVLGFLKLLNSVRKYSPATRIFYAASSLIYNGENGPYQNEKTLYSPIGFYGLTKLQGMLIGNWFRDEYKLHVCSGILYSHESVLRKSYYLSKRLISGAYLISKGKKK